MQTTTNKLHKHDSSNSTHTIPNIHNPRNNKPNTNKNTIQQNKHMDNTNIYNIRNNTNTILHTNNKNKIKKQIPKKTKTNTRRLEQI